MQGYLGKKVPSQGWELQQGFQYPELELYPTSTTALFLLHFVPF